MPLIKWRIWDRDIKWRIVAINKEGRPVTIYLPQKVY